MSSLFALSLKLSISTSTTCKTVEVFGHEGPLLATRARLLGPSNIS
jgi:hypothetical protein